MNRNGVNGRPKPPQSKHAKNGWRKNGRGKNTERGNGVKNGRKKNGSPKPIVMKPP